MTFQFNIVTLLLVNLIFIVDARFGDIGYPKRKLWANDFIDRATVETGYVDQLLDHFDPLNNSTWKQKYFYNFEFYKPGGPVLIFLGGEGPIESIWLQKGSMMELCETIDGVAFEPEHRYFGASIPTKDLTIESLKYLTIEQALADLAYFIEYIKITHYLEKRKVIVVGGSYAGSLAIWLREKYPQSMDIVWASSAPIQLDVNFPQYYEMVGSVINDINTTCYEEIKRAFDELEKLIWDCHFIATGKKSEVDRNRPPPSSPPCVRNVKKIMNETFDLCDPLNLYNEDDIRNFFSSAATYFAYIVQYNSQMGNYSMESYCGKIFTNTTIMGPLQKLSRFINDLNFSLELKCLDYNEEKYCNAVGYTGSDNPYLRSWYWLACTEFGLLQSSDGSNQPFGKSFPVSFMVRQCQCMFDKRFTKDYLKRAVQKALNYFGGRQGTKYASRLVLTNGSNDPWSVPGVLHQNQTSCANTVVYITGTSHCLDLVSTKPTELPAITHARQLIHAKIKEWLQRDLPCCQ